MSAVAHNSAFAKKVGIPQSVGKDFTAADKGRKFGRGGVPAAINKQDTRHGKMDMPFNSLKKFGGMNSGVTKSRTTGGAPNVFERTQKMASGYKTGGKMKAKMEMKKGGMPMKDGKPAFMKKFVKGGVAENGDDAQYFKKKKDSLTETAQQAREIGRQEGANRQNTAAGRGGVLGTPMAYVERAGQYIGDKFDDADAYLSEKMGMQDRATFKKGVRQGLKDAGYKKGGMAKYAKGGGIESRGKTKGTVIRMASGGSVSARADGIAQRGKTKFKNC